MLRPATPLTILFFVAFVLLLLATISTPIVKAIPLATVNGVNLGVFGYCGPNGCSKIQIGYSVDAKTLFGNSNDNSDFSLSPRTRSSLSYILIVHPVAALLTLICFILAATAHLHSPSHSSRYLLGLLILEIPTLLITLLAFLVDILLFIPHVAWGGWIVLASTILILASAVVTCAMRRTLVSRKARKKRIAENAEMNGENFYARQNPVPTGIRAESPPPLASGAIGNSDKLPTFTTFDSKTSAEEDQVPLNRRTPSNKTLPSMPGSRGPPGYSDDGSERYGGAPPIRGGPTGMRGGRGGYGPPRDEFGNSLPPPNAFGPMPPAGVRRDRSEPARMRRQYSDEAMNGWGPRGGRGRGGYPPRGYMRGGPYGPGRGGPGRGGMPMGAMGAMAAGRGPPPPGYANGYPPGRGHDNYGPAAGFGRSPSAPAYGGRGPPPGDYGRGPSPGPLYTPAGNIRAPSPIEPQGPGGYGYARDPTPEPPVQPYRQISPVLPFHAMQPEQGEIIGQAVEMDARHGSPSMSPHPEFARPMQLRDSDSDVQGFVGLQRPPNHRDSPERSLTSGYSAQEMYVPPRAAWKSTPTTRDMTPPPNTIALDPVTHDPVELPTQNTLEKPRSNSNPKGTSHVRTISSDNYYEDVDPRFASPTSPVIQDTRHTTQQNMNTASSGTVRPALMPGLTSISAHHPTIEHNGEIIDPTSSYEDMPDGQRSPASDNSNMTSISQRGINPNWNGVDPLGRLVVPSKRPVQQQRDMLLDSNPDFGLPGGRARAGSRTQGAIVPVQGQAF